MEADSFLILKENVEHDKLCLLKYDGLETIIFDETMDCITNMQISKANKATDIFLAPETLHCNLDSNNDFIDWKVDTCFNKSNFQIPAFVQVKLTDTKIFVYCFPYQIRLYSKVTQCPNSAFT